MRTSFLAVFAAVALAACSAAPPAKPDVAVPVAVSSVSVRTFTGSTEVSGNLVAARTVTVGADAAGRLLSVPVRVGDRVQTGAVLATIDGASFAAATQQAHGAYEAAAANVSVARAQLAQAQTRYRLASVSASRMATLYQQGAISHQQFDDSQAALQTAQAALDQARAAVAASAGSEAESSGALAAAEVPLGNTVIRAPFSGIVTAKMVDAGAVVNPGAPILAMEDDRSLEVELAVPETLAASLAPGTAVNVQIDATGSESAGRVRAIIPSSNPELHTATVRVSVEAGPGVLRGMFARVRLRSKPRSVVAVPWNAVVTRAGQPGVFAVADGHAHFIPVQTGDTSRGSIEVHGVRAGTQIAISNLDRVSDGTAVAAR